MVLVVLIDDSLFVYDVRADAGLIHEDLAEGLSGRGVVEDAAVGMTFGTGAHEILFGDEAERRAGGVASADGAVATAYPFGFGFGVPCLSGCSHY